MKKQYIPLVIFILTITLPFIVGVVLAYSLFYGIIATFILVGIAEWLLSPKSKAKPPELNLTQDMETKYNRFYIDEIAPYEKERKRGVRKSRIVRIVLVISAVATLVGFAQAMMEDDRYLAIAFIGFIIFTGVLKSINKSTNKITPSSNNVFINSILPTFIQKMVPGLDFNYSYRNFKQENNSEIKIIKEMLEVKEIDFNDAFTIGYDLTVDYDFGWLDKNYKVQKLYNVCESRIEQTSDRPVEARFNGLFGWRDVRGFDYNTIKIIPNSECKYEKSEDVVEKYLKLWSDVPDAAIYVPREILEYLANLYRTTGFNFEIRLKNGKIFYIFPKGHDSEINRLNKEEYKKYLFAYYYAVKTMQDITKILDK